MRSIGIGLLCLAYLLAVVDGVTQDKGLYPSGSGRIGFRRFGHQHPWLLAGALAGVVGTVLAA